MNKFWTKVCACKHKNISPNYLIVSNCGTPYCQAQEIHCLDCGVYISECGCRSCDGLSGWSFRRWIKYNAKRRTKSKSNN